jgi:hypothetical protein
LDITQIDSSYGKKFEVDRSWVLAKIVDFMTFDFVKVGDTEGLYGRPIGNAEVKMGPSFYLALCAHLPFTTAMPLPPARSPSVQNTARNGTMYENFSLPLLLLVSTPCTP